jgi:parallel beta-helix repeat protein
MVVRESKAIENIGHGFEVWDEAVASIHDSVALRNCRNGILIDSAGNGQSLEGNEVMGNREYGILLAAGASGQVKGNSVYANLLGGMLVRFASKTVVVEENHLEENTGPGLVLEQGLKEEPYQGNSTRKNSAGGVVSNVQFGATE